MTFAEYIENDRPSRVCWEAMERYIKEAETHLDPRNTHSLEIASRLLLDAGRNLSEALNSYHTAETKRRIADIENSDLSNLETRKKLLARRIVLEDYLKEHKKRWRMLIHSTLDSDEVRLRMEEDGLAAPVFEPDDDKMNTHRSELHGDEMNALIAELGGLEL